MPDEQSLRSRYRVAIESAAIGMWTWSRGQQFILWDEQARTILGLGAEARLELLDWVGLAHPDDREMLRHALAGAIAGETVETLSLILRILRAGDGAVRWISLYGRMEMAAGQPERLCGALRDITEAQDVRDSAELNEARLTAIVAIAADAIISLDAERRVTLFNDGAERLFGYDRAEILGQPLDCLIPERFHRAHREHIRGFSTGAVTSRSMAERGEIFARRKTGEEFPAEASISRVEVAGEQVLTVVLRDVTERKRAHDLLQKSRAELEARVATRTAELNAEMQRREATQAQLVRTQRMEAFGQLTGGVAHDFNNLLTVISGNLELIEMRLEDGKLRELLKRAQDAAGMGARLTSRLLTFARRRTLQPSTIDLNEHVMGMVDLLRRTLGEDIDLNARLAPRLWTIRADASEIENAVLNLAINARDAMPKGGRLVLETANVVVETDQIGTIEKLPAGDYVCLTVIDTGTGMAPDILQRAFEPFFTTKPPGKGTGLGLSTIYGFATQCGGTATIYSEVGHGTSVALYLPRADVGGVPASEADERDIAVAAGETVLLVEDNADVRLVTRERLEALGYRVLEADGGPAALQRLAAGAEVDVIFSDVVMSGGLSGFDVARRVAAERPGTRVLLASGYPDDLLRDQGAAEMQLTILRKPYSRAELARALRRLLDD